MTHKLAGSAELCATGRGNGLSKLQCRRRGSTVVAFGLFLITLLLFAGGLSNQFVYDDELYITNNVHVTGGLSWRNAYWALTTFHAANWHPLTWLSLQLDTSLCGLNARGFHLTNALLHAVAATLLFTFLNRATGRLWPSAFAAAFFALHPLRVEPVCWATERKDVLSGVFFLLTLLAYFRWVRHPAPGTYLWLLGLYVMALASKPTVVTLPLILLLLDFWPLARCHSPAVSVGNWHLLTEKLPLLFLSAGTCLVTLLAQYGGGAMSAHVDALARIANAASSYWRYLWQFACPTGLAVYYPHPGDAVPLWLPLAGALGLAAVTIIVMFFSRSAPYLFVGWLWYVIMLLPMIGIVQVGTQSMADRYTYLPSIGLCLGLAWLGSDLIATNSSYRPFIGLAATISLVTLGALTFRQIGYWRDDIVLWEHDLAVAGESEAAAYNLGRAYAGRGDPQAAIVEYRRALALNPLNPNTHVNLGLAYRVQGQLECAIQCYEAALGLNPDDAIAHNNLGMVLMRQSRFTQAEDHFATAARLTPAWPLPWQNLGNLMMRTGNPQRAREYYAKAATLPGPAK